MSLDEFFLLLVMLLNAKANVIPDFCCATEILLHLVAGLETSYCKNSNIIRTIFTNNRGPIAGVRIIHVNYENIIFQKKPVTLHKHLYQAICTRLFSSNLPVLKI